MASWFFPRLRYSGGFTEDSLLWPETECFDPEAEEEIKQLKEKRERLLKELLVLLNEKFSKETGYSLSRDIVQFMNYQHLMGYVAHITNSAGPLGPSLNDIGRLNQAQRSREDMLERRIKELDRQIAKIHRRLEELESRVLEARARQGVCP